MQGKVTKENQRKGARVRDNRRLGAEDESRCSLPWREATHRLERVGVTTKAHQCHEGSPYSPWDITHEGDSQPLVVDLEAASKPSQTFRGANHKLIPHRSTPTA